MLLTLVIGSKAFAQGFDFDVPLRSALAEKNMRDRAERVKQDNEYTSTGHEQGNFYDNPLLLNGKPLDYSFFGLGSRGELAVIKGAAATGKPTNVPFYVYLRRDGLKVAIPGKERPDPAQISVDISEVLKYAEPGDQLVIEPVRKEDGAAKRILNILGC